MNSVRADKVLSHGAVKSQCEREGTTHSARRNTQAASGRSVRAWLRRLVTLGGPGYLVAVGYMDPGNWASDIGAGSAFGYTLLSVVLLASVAAIVLQLLTARLGIATGQDLAELSRRRYRKEVGIALWVSAEIAVAATDLAEVIGTAIALNLLFGMPLIWGVCLTAADVLIILGLQHRRLRVLEMLVVVLIGVIVGCFIFEIGVSRPDYLGILAGLAPHPAIVSDPVMLYLAISILGATVMPHNLYLHSSSVRDRCRQHAAMGSHVISRMLTADTIIALSIAFVANAAILIVASATFHANGYTNVAGISEAFHLLSPIVGSSIASTLFAVALLASGLNSTITGTLAGQVVLEGFLQIRIPAWLRRLSSRLMAIVPAVIVAALSGTEGVDRLLIFSQVILSLQLPFAVVPLAQFTSDKTLMGRFANSPAVQALVWGMVTLLIVLNGMLLYQIG